MKKYPKVNRIGSVDTNSLLSGPVTVLEKMDGANFRFTHGGNVDGVSDDRLVFGSKNVIYKNEKDISKNFDHAVTYVENRLAPEQLRAAEQDYGALTLYGEAMHAHTLDYGEQRERDSGAPLWVDVPNVLVFEVFSEKEGWLPWAEVTDLCESFNLPTVPEIDVRTTVGSANELPEEVSSEYRDGIAEGIIVRNDEAEGHLRAKLRSEEFVEQHASGHSNHGDSDDTEVLVDQLLGLEPWSKKWIHRYEDQGRDMGMEVMEDLWKDVFDDIVNEEADTIFLSEKTIDMPKFRSMVASHVADQLRAYLNRPDGSALNEAQS